jgi:hypothetical protein
VVDRDPVVKQLDELLALRSGSRPSAGLPDRGISAPGAEQGHCKIDIEHLGADPGELVVDLHAVPDGVLLGAGQHRDRPGLLAVVGQGPVGVPVDPQAVGQHDRVHRVRLGPRDLGAFPVASGREGVDRIDVALGGLQAGDQQSPGGLDRDRDRDTSALTQYVGRTGRASRGLDPMDQPQGVMSGR